MDWGEIIRTFVEVALGGGLIVTLGTIKSTRRKAGAEARKEEMELAKEYVDEFRSNVAEPLQKEVKGLRRDVKMLRNAVQTVNSCPHADNCPVRSELQKQPQSGGES